MRLTVHVTNAQKGTTEKKTPEGVKVVKQTFNTLSYHDVTKDEADKILNEIESAGLGTPVKYYLSGERIPGHTRAKKKA